MAQSCGDVGTDGVDGDILLRVALGDEEVVAGAGGGKARLRREGEEGGVEEEGWPRRVAGPELSEGVGGSPLLQAILQ